MIITPCDSRTRRLSQLERSRGACPPSPSFSVRPCLSHLVFPRAALRLVVVVVVVVVVIFLFVFFHGSGVASCHSSPPGASVSTWKEVGGTVQGRVCPRRVFLRSVPLETLQFFAGLRAGRVSWERTLAFLIVVGSFAEESRPARIVASIDQRSRNMSRYIYTRNQNILLSKNCGS